MMNSIRRLSDDAVSSSSSSSSLSCHVHHHRRESSGGGGGDQDHHVAKRREVFRDCALIEIIHLHDCLRGAVKALEHDVQALTDVLLYSHGGAKPSSSSSSSLPPPQSEPSTAAADNHNNSSSRSLVPSSAVVADLEGRVFGRFKVIWSVFRAHSSAEDEFIWPALRRKTQQLQQQQQAAAAAAAAAEAAILEESSNSTSTKIPPDDEDESTSSFAAPPAIPPCGRPAATNNLVQEEYEEDHASEEVMFSEMDSLLRRLKERLNQERAASRASTLGIPPSNNNNNTKQIEPPSTLATRIMEQTHRLSTHLLRHLEKEELHCMPLVLKHLDKAEIHDLVGQIMGRRSADTITHIMTMAVQSLEEEERNEMIKYMKQSMRNTFFDQWLLASGWGSSADGPAVASAAAASTETRTPAPAREVQQSNVGTSSSTTRAYSNEATSPSMATHECHPCESHDRKRPPSAHSSPVTEKKRCVEITTQAELERLIRAIATNPGLTSAQKNTTIQGLRDSVWKKNQQERLKHGGGGCSPPAVAVNLPPPEGLPLLTQGDHNHLPVHQGPSSTRVVRVGPSVQSRSLPPAKYFRKTPEGTIEMVWSNDSPTSNPLPADGSVPTFSASELAPTYHDGISGAVFGCPHYSRACKLRHPKSGRLYTCRLCCEHQRELPMREDEPLDRYAVSEIMCMKCTTVQPASDRCINTDCTFSHKPFARYFCRICHLYDDGSREIFHCPYCNCCRLGLGLGIDYRHCMRCNACVSLNDKEHRCIPQKLQGDCPICNESLFQSTEPLRGVKCGHVMHLSCFTQYRRDRYTCPLCCKSMEDMKDHFALLDAAIRMQPMPMTFMNTMSNIYCQDCGQTGQVPYHFVGLKCAKCSSYNTREMGRVQN